MNRHVDQFTASSVAVVGIRPVKNGTSGLLAFASCVISGAVRLDNIAVRRGRDGALFLTYPNKVTEFGGKYPYFHPVSTTASNVILDAVLERLAELTRAPSQDDTGTQ